MSEIATKALHWTRHLTDEGTGRRKLALASFLESTIVPIPLEILVAPLMVANPKRAWSIAVVIWLGCLVGATLFYALGALLYEPFIAPLLTWLGLAEALAGMEARLSERGAFVALFLVSVTPVPFQIATLGAGAFGVNFFIFIAAIASSRGLRYFGLALLARLLGDRLTEALSKPLWKVSAAIGGLAVLWAAWYFAS
ncbi:YqaA family protein [Pontivivens insulae]|uniref:VTT domain-containing protein n=1 Tax=Pontivivens insulae TaxID=1639689 RepID=A0A2R8AA13_9RHOB|nr:VTT domain-containing protein [Pontivivens insulae]RED12983.1 membrane protein YqaA with SNARE-associated domain [Pontivivens insulae]SPF29076.1 hypothetical protein POI8812_01381 [Pontivivens insulae]